MDTWPNLFIENETYIPLKWDLSDLLSKIEFLRINEDLRVEVATSAQKQYKRFIYDKEKASTFSKRFKLILNKLAK